MKLVLKVVVKLIPSVLYGLSYHCLFCSQDACLDNIDITPVYMGHVLQIIEKDEDSGHVKPSDELSPARRYILKKVILGYYK